MRLGQKTLAATRPAGRGEMDDTVCAPGPRKLVIRSTASEFKGGNCSPAACALLANEVCSLTPHFPPLGAQAGCPPFPSRRVPAPLSSAAPTLQPAMRPFWEKHSLLDQLPHSHLPGNLTEKQGSGRKDKVPEPVLSGLYVWGHLQGPASFVPEATGCWCVLA